MKKTKPMVSFGTVRSMKGRTKEFECSMMRPFSMSKSGQFTMEYAKKLNKLKK